VFDFSFYATAGDNYSVASDNKSIVPAENYNGTLSVNYMISDGTVEVPLAVSVEVLPVNDDPVLATYVGSGTVDEDNSLSFVGSDFTVTDADEGDTEFFVSLGDGENYTVGSSGSILYPDPNYNGSLTVSANVSDGNGGLSNAITFSVTVSPVNDPPSVLNLAITPADPDYFESLVVTYTFSDIDGDTEIGTVIQWYKNDELQTAETSDTVSSNSIACDEVWYAVVTPGSGIRGDCV
jgi:hypothetical protein